eukprot:g29762.t1
MGASACAEATTCRVEIPTDACSSSTSPPVVQESTMLARCARGEIPIPEDGVLDCFCEQDPAPARFQAPSSESQEQRGNLSHRSCASDLERRAEFYDHKEKVEQRRRERSTLNGKDPVRTKAARVLELQEQYRSLGVNVVHKLGNWNVQRAPSLSTDATEYPKWSGTLPCTVGELEFKFVKVAENGDAEWEDGKNRSIKISEDGDIVIPNGSATPNTMTFGHTEETNAPRQGLFAKTRLPKPYDVVCRLASGGSRKTSFSDEVEEVAVPVPITPKTKVPTSLLDESDELHFNVVCSITGIGDAVSVVGSCPELGNWDVRRGIKLCTSADLFPQWAGVLHLKSCSFCDIEFKIVVCRISCDEWEGTQNRRLSMPGDDLEGPWEAFLSFNVNGCRIAKFRTNMIDIVEPETGRRERRARRSTSLSLLAPREQPPLVAETWVRCRNDREEAVAGPPLKEHLLMLKLKGIPQSEARKLFVELVFEAKSQRPIVPLDMSSFDNDELQAAWSVAIPAVELPVGTNYFHFRVNGVFTLSLEHNRVGKWNAVYNSDSIRRYLLARDGRGQLLDKKEGQMVEKTRSKQIGDMAFDLIVGDASSANQSGLQADREGQIARPYSVCGHLGLADAGEDNETKEWDAAGIPQNKRIHHTMPRKLN